jgi:hypothetical protein
MPEHRHWKIVSLVRIVTNVATNHILTAACMFKQKTRVNFCPVSIAMTSPEYIIIFATLIILAIFFIRIWKFQKLDNFYGETSGNMPSIDCDPHNNGRESCCGVLGIPF